MLCQSQLILYGHILNPFWANRAQRRKKRYDATLKSVMRYLRRYAPAIRKVTPAPLNNPGEEPERIFAIWFQGEEQAPPLVKACFRSMRRHLDMPLVVLDEKTLFEWIKLPEYVVKKWKEGKIPHTQFSDICRVELLYQHGGLWFDATDYITAPIPQWVMDEDVFLFQAGQKIRYAYTLIQSCFIRGRKGNPLLGIWREANYIYWKEENSKIDYFVHHLLLRTAVENNPIASAAFARMPKRDQDPTHTLWTAHCDEPYNEQVFKELTSGSFFQKTNYKDKRIPSLPEGSIGEYIINS